MIQISICWSLVVLYQTWLPFAYTHLLMQNSIHSWKEIKTFWRNFQNMLLVVNLSLLHAKQLLMKLLFGSLQTHANLMLEVMPANKIPYRFVNQCPAIFIRDGISIQKPVDSYLDKTRPVSQKMWSCFIFNERDLIVQLRASTLQADRRQLTASVLMGFVLIAILCLKQWVAFITSVLVKSCVLLSLKRFFNAVAGRESWMRWDDTICKKKASSILKCEVWMVETVQNNQNCWTTYPRTLSLQAFICSWATCRRDKERKGNWIRAVRYRSTWKFENKLCELPSNFQEHLS